MLRLWLPLFLSLGIPFTVAYPVIAWLSWVPNLVVAEVYLWGRGRKEMRRLPAAPARA